MTISRNSRSAWIGALGVIAAAVIGVAGERLLAVADEDGQGCRITIRATPHKAQPKAVLKEYSYAVRDHGSQEVLASVPDYPGIPYNPKGDTFTVDAKCADLALALKLHGKAGKCDRFDNPGGSAEIDSFRLNATPPKEIPDVDLTAGLEQKERDAGCRVGSVDVSIGWKDL